MIMRFLSRRLSPVFCLFTIFLLYCSVVSASQIRGNKEEHLLRQLQSSAVVFPVFGQLAVGLNDRIYNGARVTQDLVSRINEQEASNPQSLLTKAKTVLSQSTAEGQSSSSTVDELQSAFSSAREQLLQLMDRQRGGTRTTRNAPVSVESSAGVAQPLESGRFMSGFNSLMETIAKNLKQTAEQKPSGTSSSVSESSEANGNGFQSRMDRLAEMFMQPNKTAAPRTPELLTVGPLKSSQQEQPSTKPLESVGPIANNNLGPITNIGPIIVEEEKKLLDEDECWRLDWALEADEFRSKEGLDNATACRDYSKAKQGKFFSFDSKLKRCYTYDEIRSIQASDKFISGPIECSSFSGEKNLGGIVWPRRLQEVHLSASDYDVKKTDCLVADTAISGEQVFVLQGIVSPAACQINCEAVNTCEYFTFYGGSQKCYLYSKASSVRRQMGMTSGPRSCAEGEAEKPDRSGEAGPLIPPGEEVIDGQQAQPGNQAKSSDEVVQGAAYPEKKPEQGGGLLGLLGLGNVLFGGQGGLLGRGSELIGRGSEMIGGQDGMGREVESVGGLGSMMRTFHTVMSAGDTVMKTFPISDLVKAGYELQNSGALRRQPRGGGKKDATAPPTGVGVPTASCLSEGMRCCVPRLSAPKYQVEPPKLNGIDNLRCVATYVSQWDSLCATTRYDDEECGTTLVETGDFFVYRNVLELPGKTMNNALCECTVPKKGGDVQNTAKWEYSLALKEEAEATKRRNEEALVKLANAAKVAVQWGEALQTRQTPTSSQGGGSSTNFFSSVLDLVNDANGGESSASSSSEGSASGRSTAKGGRSDQLNTAALVELLKELRENPEKSRKLQSVEKEDSSDHPHQPVLIPVPVNCSVWRKGCEKNLERLLFDEKCQAVKIVQNGCPRDDTEFTLLDFPEPSANPTYRVRVPFGMGLDALGVTCEFVVTDQASVCASGDRFRVPEQTLSDDPWAEIRQRGPLMELLVFLLTEFEVDPALLVDLLVQGGQDISASGEQQPTGFYTTASSYSPEATEWNNVRGRVLLEDEPLSSDEPLLSRELQATNGAYIYLNVGNLKHLKGGDRLAATFEVPYRTGWATNRDLRSFW